MQLDKTAIVISQRTTTDVVDLSLIVFRSYWKSILLFAFVGVLPFFLANFVLMWPMSDYDLLAIQSYDYSSTNLYRFRYYCVTVVAVFLQAPLAMVLVTNFIGQAVFVEQQSFRQVCASVIKQWRQVFVVLGLYRLGLITYVALWFEFTNPEFEPSLELSLYLFGFVVIPFAIRAFRPFAPEILVLERSKLRVSKSPNESQSYKQRSQWLHSTQHNDNFGSHIVLSLIAGATAVAFSFGVLFVSGVLTGLWNMGWIMDCLVFPIVCWGIATWMCVVRFLFYMNSRIRTEGWEIELRFKAEAERWKGAVT